MQPQRIIPTPTELRFPRQPNPRVSSHRRLDASTDNRVDDTNTTRTMTRAPLRIVDANAIEKIARKVIAVDHDHQVPRRPAIDRRDIEPKRPEALDRTSIIGIRREIESHRLGRVDDRNRATDLRHRPNTTNEANVGHVRDHTGIERKWQARKSAKELDVTEMCKGNDDEDDEKRNAHQLLTQNTLPQ